VHRRRKTLLQQQAGAVGLEEFAFFELVVAGLFVLGRIDAQHHDRDLVLVRGLGFVGRDFGGALLGCGLLGLGCFRLRRGCFLLSGRFLVNLVWVNVNDRLSLHDR
jgi:hypothetical protein